MLELKLIKFSDLNKYLTCQFMHELNYGLVSNVFNDYFTLFSSLNKCFIFCLVLLYSHCI